MMQKSSQWLYAVPFIIMQKYRQVNVFTPVEMVSPLMFISKGYKLNFCLDILALICLLAASVLPIKNLHLLPIYILIPFVY